MAAAASADHRHPVTGFVARFVVRFVTFSSHRTAPHRHRGRAPGGNPCHASGCSAALHAVGPVSDPMVRSRDTPRGHRRSQADFRPHSLGRPTSASASATVSQIRKN